jgi:hypothetical protein
MKHAKLLILTMVAANVLGARASLADSVDDYNNNPVNSFGRVPSGVHYDSNMNNAVSDSTYHNDLIGAAPAPAEQPLDTCTQDRTNPEQAGPVSSLARNLVPVVKPEISAGVTEYTKTGNGTWYQEGFPYQMQLTQGSVGVGGVLDLNEKTHLRFGVQDMGLNFSVAAEATPSDANYAACKNNMSQCWPAAHWYGTGAEFNAYLALERDIPTKAGTFVVEGGPTANTYIYNENIPDWYGSPGAQRHDVQVGHSIFHGVFPGLMVGIGYKINDKTTIMATYQKYFPTPQNVPPAWGTTMYNVSLLHQF